MNCVRSENRDQTPVEIRAGSAVVKIYTVKHKRCAAGVAYTAVWYEGRARRTYQSTSMDKARSMAKKMAEQIRKGRRAGEFMTIEDVDALSAARAIVGDASLMDALREWKAARALAGDHLLEAARTWKDTHGTDFESVRVANVVERFIDAKVREGVAVQKTYILYLRDFTKRFGTMPIHAITTQAITGHLDTYADAVYRNTHRRRIVTLFRWAARQGYLPQNQKTQAELTDAMREKETAVEVFTVSEWRTVLRLIANDHPHYIAPVVLAGFMGMRTAEIHAQTWESIDLSAGHLHVDAAKPRTPQDRLVPIPAAAMTWLMMAKNKVGKVCRAPDGKPNKAIERVRDVLRAAGIATPANGFRHSAITYAIAQGQTPGQVAQWAGNSERQIHRHYRRPRPKAEGEAWFAMTPDVVLKNRDNVVEMQV